MARLSISEQKELLRLLPVSKQRMLKRVAMGEKCGGGLFSAFKIFAKILGPTVVGAIAGPAINKLSKLANKAVGNGLSPAGSGLTLAGNGLTLKGNGCGCGLKLAGSGKKKRGRPRKK